MEKDIGIAEAAPNIWRNINGSTDSSISNFMPEGKAKRMCYGAQCHLQCEYFDEHMGRCADMNESSGSKPALSKTGSEHWVNKRNIPEIRWQILFCIDPLFLTTSEEEEIKNTERSKEKNGHRRRTRLHSDGRVPSKSECAPHLMGPRA